MYFLNSSSGIIWEYRKSSGSRWRSLNPTEVNLIEEGYQQYIRELQVDKEAPYRVMLAPKLEVIFLFWKHKGFLF